MSDLAVVDAAGPLAALRHAHSLLESASSLDEVKRLRDKAESLRHYCEAAGLGLVMQNRCAELKLRAERKAGELLSDIPLEARSHGATHLRDVVEEFVSPGACRAAAHCWRCNRSGGLTLDGNRFACRGWCGRLDEEIVAEKGRSWVGQSPGRSSGKTDRSQVATGGALGPGLAPAHTSMTEPAGVTSTGGS